ncbi:MAG: hypothetical protein ACKVY0_19265 [Prosthecobacter sp.]|uniref:hypothetical protein n=1 Tax=Prosthecobacter sp. TaxID=1965333 RepID=UPI00390010AE
MKTFFKLAAVAALTASSSLSAADCEINIIGATAFRAGVHAALLASSGGLYTGGPTKYSHSSGSGSVSGATRSSWVGTVAGVGTVTVRTFWTGSVTGIQDVSQGNTKQFLADSTLPTSGQAFSQTTLGTAVAAHATFSDCAQSSTNFTANTLDEVNVGVVPFVFVLNDTATTPGFDNVTAQFARALYNAGSVPKKLLTGVAGDNKKVYCVGRDTGSGTRVISLAETKFGVFTQVKHYRITTSGGNINTLRFWPSLTIEPLLTGPLSGAGNDATSGNGGYTSGSTFATLMQDKSDGSIAIQNASGTTVATETGGVHLITGISYNDTPAIVTGGGTRLKYEGVAYNGTADDDKVRNGQYTFWSFEKLLNVTTLSQDQIDVRDALVTAIDANISGSGIQLSTMIVGRQEDGGIVAP